MHAIRLLSQYRKRKIVFEGRNEDFLLFHLPVGSRSKQDIRTRLDFVLLIGIAFQGIFYEITLHRLVCQAVCRPPKLRGINAKSSRILETTKPIHGNIYISGLTLECV